MWEAYRLYPLPPRVPTGTLWNFPLRAALIVDLFALKWDDHTTPVKHDRHLPEMRPGKNVVIQIE